MTRVSTLSTLSAAAILLSACSASFSIGQQSASTLADCAGKDGKCTVAEHDAHQPVVAAELDTRIHDYLLAHPEIIADAQRVAGQKQAEARQAVAKQALAANHEAIFNNPADPVIGNPKGDVAIVIFEDRECPFCKRIAPEIDALIKADPNVKVVLKEYPILGPVSETAAKYALASLRQGPDKYAAFHTALMASTIQEHQLTEANILDFAAKSGLDIARLKTDAASPTITAQIAANRAMAQKIGVTGTPGVIIGDTIEPGLMTLDAMKSAVAAARMRKVASAQ